MSSIEQRVDALEDAVVHLTVIVNELMGGMTTIAKAQQDFMKMFTPASGSKDKGDGREIS